MSEKKRAIIIASILSLIFILSAVWTAHQFLAKKESASAAIYQNGTLIKIISNDHEETFRIEDGVRYHHILDTKTGYPAESGLISVTIVCEKGWLSDGLSTACFVLGYEDSLPLLETYQAEAVFVTEDKEVIVTDGLKDMFTLTDSSYEQVEE